jgi:transposase InsO family protein
MKQAGIVHITSPVGHPQSNGQAECFVKNVKAALDKNQQSNKNQTEDVLNDYNHNHDIYSPFGNDTLSG